MDLCPADEAPTEIIIIRKVLTEPCGPCRWQGNNGQTAIWVRPWDHRPPGRSASHGEHAWIHASSRQPHFVSHGAVTPDPRCFRQRPSSGCGSSLASTTLQPDARGPDSPAPAARSPQLRSARVHRHLLDACRVEQQQQPPGAKAQSWPLVAWLLGAPMQAAGSACTQAGLPGPWRSIELQGERGSGS